MDPTSVYIDETTARLLDNYIKLQRVEVSRSAVFRAAVREFIAKKR